MVYFHRPPFLPLSLYYKKRVPMYTLWHGYNNIYRYNMCFFGFRQNEPLCVRAPASAEGEVFGTRV